MYDRIEFLRELTDAPGPSGYEGPVSKIMEKRLASHCTFRKDRLGSLIARKTGIDDGPKIMLAGHMDEPAFLIRHVTDKGFLRFIQLTGWWPQRTIGQVVDVLAPSGPIPGIIDCKNEMRMRPEERQKPFLLDDLYIDVGAKNAEQVYEWGIRPGITVIPSTKFTIMANGSRYMAKGWDDRVGCGMAADTILELDKRAHKNIVYAVGTVQEELGSRGAQTAGTAIKPDVGIALDVSVATDTPSLEGDDIVPIVLGKGPTIDIYEHNFMPDPALVELTLRTAQEEKIPIQYNVVAAGGTDAHPINLIGEGIPCLVIGMPTRYVHAMAGVIDADDFDMAVRLLAAVVAKLDSTTVKTLGHF